METILQQNGPSIPWLSAVSLFWLLADRGRKDRHLSQKHLFQCTRRVVGVVAKQNATWLGIGIKKKKTPTIGAAAQ